MTVVQAEWSVLLRRWSARATLALSVLLPLLVLGIFRALGAEDAALQFNGKPVSEIVDLTAANAATASELASTVADGGPCWPLNR